MYTRPPRVAWASSQHEVWVPRATVPRKRARRKLSLLLLSSLRSYIATRLHGIMIDRHMDSLGFQEETTQALSPAKK